MILKRAQSLNLCCLLAAGFFTLLPMGVQEANASPGDQPAYLTAAGFTSLKPGPHKFEVNGHGLEISIPEKFSFKQSKGEANCTLIFRRAVSGDGPDPQYSIVMIPLEPGQKEMPLKQFCESMKELTGRSTKNFVPSASTEVPINGLPYYGFGYSAQTGTRPVKGFTLVAIQHRMMYMIGRLDEPQHFQENDAVFNELMKSSKYF